MKTIEERAMVFADRHEEAELSLRGLGGVYGYNRIKNAEICAYKRGAEEQRKIDIDKACELIEKALQKLTTYKDRDNFTENEFKIITVSRVPNWLIKFRKAMEE